MSSCILVNIFLFVLVIVFIQQRDARPPTVKSRSFEEARGLLQYLSEDKQTNYGRSRQPSERKVNTKAIDKRKIKKTFTKEEIDSQKVDTNSDLEILLESMSDNDKKAEGIHPDQKGSVKAMVLEEKHEKEQGKHIHSIKRNFIPRLEIHDRYWPNATIPYYIDIDAFDNKDNVLRILRETRDEFEEKTCVKLVPKTEDELEEAALEFYVNVTNYPDGCYSAVGLFNDEGFEQKGQILNLEDGEDGNCIFKSTAIHEFCHALGMVHEQSRQDRDKHVIVNFDNVDEEIKHNLEKQKSLDKNPYDYYSVMQYELKSFTTKSWENSISFRNPDLEFLAGASPGLSFYDVMDITRAYECTAQCPHDIPCTNGGFRNHNCECYCPEGLIGRNCDKIDSATFLIEEIESLKQDCGGIIDLNPGKEIYITSPNYPNNYEVGQICYWLLRAENVNQRVMIQVLDFDLPSNEELSRCYHWLEVRYNLVGQPGQKFCGDTFPKNKISTTEYGNPDLMMLIFDTATVTGVEASKGFLMKVNAVEINPEGCRNDPPEIENSSDNFAEVGSSIGAIILYKCDYYYQMIGHNSITCEADGTWSNVRFECVVMEPVFECDFESSKCGITFENDRGFNWLLKEEGADEDVDYNAYLSVTSTTNTSTYARFIIPEYLRVDTAYCLSFYFRRTSSSDQCATLYVGDFISDRWTYEECKEGEWILFEGNYGPWDDVTEETLQMFFTADIENEDGGEYNIDLDDIIISEGTC